MAYFLLIRHGKTQGNLERRYIGEPEEPLTEEGIRDIEVLVRNGELPPVERLYAGPALRCRQTMALLFPGRTYNLCSLYEINFGAFKGKNADDLRGDKAYEMWLETGCMGDIPGGDSVKAFKDYCCETFERLAEIPAGRTQADEKILMDRTDGDETQVRETNKVETTAFVIHGGNIMAILERFAFPKRDFYDYYLPNCGFFLCRLENGMLTIVRKGGIA